jgi:hypothetical protein
MLNTVSCGSHISLPRKKHYYDPVIVLVIYKIDIPYIPYQSKQCFHNYINILTVQIISINPYKLIQTLFAIILKNIFIIFKIRQIIGNKFK